MEESERYEQDGDITKRICDLFCPECSPKAIALVEALEKQVEEPEEPEEPRKPRKKRLPKEGQENWVSLRKIFKTSKVPEGVADVIKRALEKMKCAGDISEDNLFQLLEYLCANYLAEN